jgi:polyphosphate kinase
MPRNLYERVEVQFPITDPKLIARIRDEILATYLADTAKARLLRPDGTWVRPRVRGRRFSAQEHLMSIAEGRVASNVISLPPRPAPQRKRRNTG